MTRQALRLAAGVLGLASVVAFAVNPGALGGYFGLPLAVLALVALWQSGSAPSSASDDVGTSSDGVRAPDAKDRPVVSAIAVIGVLAALLVVCAYGLYVASYLL